MNADSSIYDYGLNKYGKVRRVNIQTFGRLCKIKSMAKRLNTNWLLKMKMQITINSIVTE